MKAAAALLLLPLATAARADPDAATVGGLAVRAARQLGSGRTGELSGADLTVENPTDRPVVLAVEKLELLSQPAALPGATPPPVRATPLAIAGVYYQEGGATHIVRDGGRGPVKLTLAPHATIALTLQFARRRASLAESYWRRITVAAAGERAAVTGPFAFISFSGGQVEGQARGRLK